MTLTSYENLVIGRTYTMHHSRKGNCTFRVDDWYTIDDDTDAFVTGMVVSGHLKGIGIGVGSHRGHGDTATVRWSLCTFTETTKGTVK